MLQNETFLNAREQRAFFVTNKELRETVLFMRRNGVLKFKTMDFELEIDPNSIKLPVKRSNKKVDTSDEPPKLSEEDVLLWSAPGMMPPNPFGGEP